MTTLLTLIEADPLLLAELAESLNRRGFRIAATGSGRGGLRLVVDHHPDLVLLDLGVSDMSGVDFLRMVRAVSTVPVIVSSTRAEDELVVRSLEAGADDYLVKPFTPDLLEARVRAVLRRAGRQVERRVTVGQLRIDRQARQATLEGNELNLRPKEFELLLYLAERAGRVVPKAELMSEVWKQPSGGAEKTLDVHLSWLRRKLGETPRAPRYLRVCRGVGVKLLDPTG